MSTKLISCFFLFQRIWLFIYLFVSFRIRKAGDCLIANKFRLDVSASAVLLQRLNVLKITLQNWTIVATTESTAVSSLLVRLFGKLKNNNNVLPQIEWENTRSPRYELCLVVITIKIGLFRSNSILIYCWLLNMLKGKQERQYCH